MNDREVKLRERLRVSTQERVARMLHALRSAAPGDMEEARRSVLGMLHTTKGEAMLLGVEPLAASLHAFETLLAAAPAGELGPESAARRSLESALARLQLLLRDHALERDAGLDAQLHAVTSMLEGRGRSSELPARLSVAPTSHAVASRPAARDTSVMRVHVGDIDATCDALRALQQEFAALASMVKSDDRVTDVIALRELVDRCQQHLDAAALPAWALRTADFEAALEDLRRHAEELGRARGKDIRVTASGAGVQLDRHVLELLWEPLLHLVTNAIEHGIETAVARGDKPPSAQLRLDARALSGGIEIVVEDDGVGIDGAAVCAAAIERGMVSAERASLLSEDEAVNLIFEHGLSTRGEADHVAGRGIGLDVVRRVVESLGGRVSVVSRFGQGTTFRMLVPAMLAREPVLVFESAGEPWALPARDLLAVVARAERERHTEDAPLAPYLLHEGARVPILSFSALVSGEARVEPRLLVVESSVGARAIAVERVVGEARLVRWQLDALLACVDHVAGSGTLEDGRLVLVLSTSGLIRRAERAGTAITAPRPERRSWRVLAVDDSAIVRDLVERLLTDAGFEVETAENGAVAFERLVEGHFHLVLVDLEMPVVDGIELARRIRDSAITLPVVMFSTQASLEQRARAYDAGVDEYLIKSDLAGAELVATLERVLEARA